MEMILNNNFLVIENDDLELIEGGLAPVVIAAYLALLGTGFTAGFAVGLNKKNNHY